MAEVLAEFPALTMTLPDGREESIMKRTCLVGGAHTCGIRERDWDRVRCRGGRALVPGVSCQAKGSGDSHKRCAPAR